MRRLVTIGLGAASLAALWTTPALAVPPECAGTYRAWSKCLDRARDKAASDLCDAPLRACLTILRLSVAPNEPDTASCPRVRGGRSRC